MQARPWFPDFQLALQDSLLGFFFIYLGFCYTLQVSGGYGAPELELGTYTQQSDVFSFGIVMLELLTGRKAYDRLILDPNFS